MPGKDVVPLVVGESICIVLTVVQSMACVGIDSILYRCSGTALLAVCDGLCMEAQKRVE